MTNTVQQVLDDLSSCLCAQFEIDESPPLCFCGVVPGLSVALEYQGNCADDACGMAWIRLSSVYGATGVGQISVTPNNCQVGIGVDVEVGVMRCINPGSYDGSAPPPEVLCAATEQEVKDMLSVRAAVQCCAGSQDMILGQFTPFGPEGGTYGFTVELNFLVM